MVLKHDFYCLNRYLLDFTDSLDFWHNPYQGNPKTLKNHGSKSKPNMHCIKTAQNYYNKTSQLIDK